MRSVVATTVALLVMALPLAAQCTLSISGTVNPGETITLSLTGAPPGAPTVLAVGETPGSHTFNLGPLGSITIGLHPPFTLLPLGHTDGNGELTFSQTIPSNIPPGVIPNLTLHAQTVTVEITFSPPGPPSLNACVSNLVPVQVGSGS